MSKAQDGTPPSALYSTQLLRTKDVFLDATAFNAQTILWYGLDGLNDEIILMQNDALSLTNNAQIK